MLPSCQQNLGQNRNMKLGKRSFENAAKLKYEYLGMALKNQNGIHKKLRIH
jgi:hypothetical protein